MAAGDATATTRRTRSQELHPLKVKLFILILIVRSKAYLHPLSEAQAQDLSLDAAVEAHLTGAPPPSLSVTFKGIDPMHCLID